MNRSGPVRSQVFVGSLAHDTKTRDLENVFSKYGRLTRCDIKYGNGMAYAFIDYEDRRDAEDAVRKENGRELNGNRMVVEWARGPSDRYRQVCDYCGRMGHFYKNCLDYREREERSGGPSRSSKAGGGAYGREDRYDAGPPRYDSRRDRSRSRSPRPPPPRRGRSPSYD